MSLAIRVHYVTLSSKLCILRSIIMYGNGNINNAKKSITYLYLSMYKTGLASEKYVIFTGFSFKTISFLVCTGKLC